MSRSSSGKLSCAAIPAGCRDVLSGPPIRHPMFVTSETIPVYYIQRRPRLKPDRRIWLFSFPPLPCGPCWRCSPWAWPCFRPLPRLPSRPPAGFATRPPTSAWSRRSAGTAGRETIPLGLEFRLSEGWKVYWRSAGDVGYPPEVDWSGSSNLAAAATDLPGAAPLLGLRDRAVRLFRERRLPDHRPPHRARRAARLAGQCQRPGLQRHLRPDRCRPDPGPAGRASKPDRLHPTARPLVGARAGRPAGRPGYRRGQRRRQSDEPDPGADPDLERTACGSRRVPGGAGRPVVRQARDLAGRATVGARSCGFRWPSTATPGCPGPCWN